MSQRIVLATTAGVPNREIKEVVDIVSAEVAVGMNIFKDLLTNRKLGQASLWSRIK